MARNRVDLGDLGRRVWFEHCGGRVEGRLVHCDDRTATIDSDDPLHGGRWTTNVGGVFRVQTPKEAVEEERQRILRALSTANIPMRYLPVIQKIVEG